MSGRYVIQWTTFVNPERWGVGVWDRWWGRYAAQCPTREAALAALRLLESDPLAELGEVIDQIPGGAEALRRNLRDHAERARAARAERLGGES